MLKLTCCPAKHLIVQKLFSKGKINFWSPIFVLKGSLQLFYLNTHTFWEPQSHNLLLFLKSLVLSQVAFVMCADEFSK